MKELVGLSEQERKRREGVDTAAGCRHKRCPQTVSTTVIRRLQIWNLDTGIYVCGGDRREPIRSRRRDGWGGSIPLYPRHLFSHLGRGPCYPCTCCRISFCRERRGGAAQKVPTGLVGVRLAEDTKYLNNVDYVFPVHKVVKRAKKQISGIMAQVIFFFWETMLCKYEVSSDQNVMPIRCWKYP